MATSGRVRGEGSHGSGARAVVGGLVLAAALAARLSYLAWEDPYGPHHPDEHILSLESVALWEGVTPREVGWPAAPTRLVLSAINACRLAGSGELRQPRMDLRLRHVSAWIGRQWTDQSGLYATGRATSALVGVLAVLATWWALGRWLPWPGAALGATAAAVSPIAVAYSQFVLADVMGVLWSTLVLGLVRLPVTTRSTIAAAAAAGLAAASKFHFGVWLVAVWMAIWLAPGLSRARRVRHCMLGCLVFGSVVLVLVPWFVTSPVLAAKEFGGVVLVKLGTLAPRGTTWHWLTLLLGGFGAFTLVGAALGCIRSIREDRTIWIALVPALIALVALFRAEIVFDRYGLVIAPALFLLAGSGWRGFADRQPLNRVLATAAVLALAMTIVSLVQTWRLWAPTGADRLAAAWVTAHVRAGSRVGLHSEANAFVPREAADLRRCAAHVWTDAAYTEKWASNGIAVRDAEGTPFRNAVLNDELFEAYSCSRELLAGPRAGYALRRFHDQPRFDTLLTAEAEHAFDTRGAGPDGLDVLVLNHARRTGAPPVVTLRNGFGARFVYAWPDALIDGTTPR